MIAYIPITKVVSRSFTDITPHVSLIHKKHLIRRKFVAADLLDTRKCVIYHRFGNQPEERVIAFCEEKPVPVIILDKVEREGVTRRWLLQNCCRVASVTGSKIERGRKSETDKESFLVV